MNKLVIAILVASSSAAWAQNKPRVDDCKPIGRTDDGKLVYSMKCENIPKPPTPVVEKNNPPPENSVADVQEDDKGGLFRFPFGSSIGVTNHQQKQGVGPAFSR